MMETTDGLKTLMWLLQAGRNTYLMLDYMNFCNLAVA